MLVKIKFWDVQNVSCWEMISLKIKGKRNIFNLKVTNGNKGLSFLMHRVWAESRFLTKRLMCNVVFDTLESSTKGTAIKDITDSLYQRHYKTWSLYIFVFLYIIRDVKMLVEGEM